MARERRMEKALSWVGVGTVAGALLLAAVTVALHRAGSQGTGVIEEAGMGWFWACVLGGFVLILGVRRQTLRANEEPDTESGWDYPLCLAGVAAVTALIAGNGALLGAGAPGIGELSPTVLRMAIVVCAVPLGVLLMLTVVRRPLLSPRTHSLPSFGAGALAVALVGTTVPLLLLDKEETGARHVVAEDLPERAAVPAQVRRAGWTWEPGHEVRIEWIARGAHGPLAVLSDGVVSLDGTDGTEIWSYRKPVAGDVSAWVGNGRVLFSHLPERDEEAEGRDEDEPEEQVTQVLDLVTGELVTEYSTGTGEDPDGGVGALVGWSDGVRVHNDRRGDLSGVSAWDAESGEELWYRILTPEPGMSCTGGQPLVRAETVVYAAACVPEDELAEGDHSVDWTLRLEDVDKRFGVVVVDLRTGEERWSHEIAGEQVFEPGRPWVAPGAGDQGSVLVVPDRFSSDSLLLLDAETGAEVMHLSEGLTEIEEDLGWEEVLNVDADGVTVLLSRTTGEYEVGHIDPDGNLTALVEPGGAYLRDTTDSAVLAEQVLFTDNVSEALQDRAQVRVASHGERLGEGLRNRIVLESRGNVEQLVVVRGGVAVLLNEQYRSGVRVEGLVP